MAPGIEKLADGRYAVRGDLVYETVGGVSREADRTLDFDADAEVDLSGLGAVNSAGLALLVDWVARFRQHRRKLRFTHVSAHLRQLVDVNGLEALFTE